MSKHEVAIVGVGCRFPGGATTPSAWWDYILECRDGVRAVPRDRWGREHYDPDPRVPGRSYVERAGYLDDPALSFDAAFFGISPREAETLDPQQRMLLEVAWEAIDDAGARIEDLRGSATGVFVGGFTLDSMLLRFRELDDVDNHTATSSTMTVLSSRISYTFDLRGPSLTVDTACSSSLVAVHLACRALLADECSLALAGGVNAMLLPNLHVVMCKGRLLSADGRSKAFDVDADGYGRGEGAAIVALKRLEDAVRDGDRIYAVIRGSGVNQDGATDGMPQPSSEAQEALIRSVCQRFSIDPGGVGYIEAHGTGTAIGDPTEVRALGAVYGRPGRGDAPRIGSLKANIGHLEAAAGVAGLVKAALVVKHKVVPPQRRPRAINPALQLDARGLVLPERVEPWPVAARAVAAVNSFGYGGTNAHAVLEEPPSRTPMPTVGEVRLIPVTARGEDALCARATQLAQFLQDGAPFERVVATLARRRSHLETRAAILASDPEQAVAALRALAEGRPHSAVVGPAPSARRTLWVYSGMGPQWWGMGAELYAAEPAFARGLDAACDAMAAHGLHLRGELFLDQARSRMSRNDVAQPGNFALQVGLTAWLRSHGAEPDAIVGHSGGEIAAAWAAGALSLDDAAAVVTHRSLLQQEVAGGGMLAVGCSAVDLQRYTPGIDGLIEVAAYNADTSLTIAGDRAALAVLAQRLEAAGIFARAVRVEVAYHSAHMDPIGDRLREALTKITPTPPRVRLFSTVTGLPVDRAFHDADYWWRNTRSPVRLADAVRAAVAEGCDTFVEIGPHPVLSPAIGEVAGPKAALLHLLKRQVPEQTTALLGLAALWTRGAHVSWEDLAPRGEPVDLPTYPWQRRRHWRVSPTPRSAHPLLQERLDGPEPCWTARADLSSLAWLRDHRIRGAAILPAAAWVEAMLAATLESLDRSRGAVLTDIRLHAALSLEEPGTVQVLRTEVRGDDVVVHARTGHGGWQRHAEARLLRTGKWSPLAALDGPAVRARCTEQVDVEALYADLTARGLEYGPAFRGIARLWRGEREVLAEVNTSSAPTGSFILPPAALDAAFQALLGLEPASRRTLLPVGIGRLRIGASAPAERWLVHGIVRRDDGEELVGDLRIALEDGTPVADVLELRCRLLAAPSAPSTWWHVPSWMPAERAVPTGAWTVLGHRADEVRAALADAGCDVRVGAPQVLWIAPESEDPTGRALASQLASVVRECAGGASDLVVVTRDAWSVAGERTIRPSHAALWGVARVAMTEYPGLRTRLVDVEEGALVGSVPAAIGSHDEESAVRAGARYVGRLVRPGGEQDEARRARRAVQAGTVPARLVAERPGELASLVFEACRRDVPGPGMVEVEVETAALNFKDLMKAMGLLDAVALEQSYLGTDLGLEGVGRIVRVGEGVDLQPGQRVLVYQGGCLRTHVIADARFVLPWPEQWTDEAAASFFVLATAWHSLVDIGRLRAGETVLIHSAAGGVGLAAVQVARARGARVIATAGTSEKREYLRTLGVEHVFDSRTLDFADDVLEATHGRGVDVVLNSLSGSAIERGLACLAPGGRFLELGKKDLGADRSLALLPFNRRLTLTAIDLDRATSEDPGYFQPLAAAVFAAMERGDIGALPVRRFAADEVEAAFRALASGGVIGKVVVELRRGRMLVAEHASGTFRPRAGRTWLVTGGLGGFGLATASWLTRQGVTHLVLASRRGKASDAGAVAALARRAHVEQVALDVSDGEAVRALVRQIEQSGRPLGGVVHAAMVLADRPIAALDDASLGPVLAPKALGAWHLHEATRDLDLDAFVLFGSVAAQVGNPGQAAYAAANAFLDGLAEHRRVLGLPAISVAWGAIGSVGVVARDAATAAHLRSVGVEPMPPELALDALGRAIADGFVRLALADIDWGVWTRANPGTSWARLEALLEDDRGAGGGWLQTLASTPADERLGAAVEALQGVAAGVFRLPAAEIHPERPLRDHGLDSLMAVELATTLDRSLGVEVSAMDLLGGRSLAMLAQRIVERVDVQAAGPALASADRPTTPEALRASIDVSAPYEAFRTLRVDGDRVHAEVEPDVLADEPGPVATAEIGRHLAILGSMAASLRNPVPGRHCYPVRTADLELDVLEGPPAERARLVAWCTGFDAAAGTASAEAELYDLDGRRLGRLRVSYHVMTVETLHALFSVHARPDTPSTDNPYRAWTPAPVVSAGVGRVEARIDAVDPAGCAGHFAGLPALPVSIMGRHVFRTAAEAARTEGAELRVRRAAIETFRFVWAGEEARFIAVRDGEGWRCEIRTGDWLAATFRLDVESVALARVAE